MIKEKKVNVLECKCERCDYEWTSRTEEKPIVCPQCKSPYWDKRKKIQGDEP